MNETSKQFEIAEVKGEPARMRMSLAEISASFYFFRFCLSLVLSFFLFSFSLDHVNDDY